MYIVFFAISIGISTRGVANVVSVGSGGRAKVSGGAADGVIRSIVVTLSSRPS
jgi:hypothetical protein